MDFSPEIQASIDAAALAIARVIASAVGQVGTPIQSRQGERWLSRSEALKVFSGSGFAITKSQLFHRKNAGIYREGTHYRNIASASSQRPTYEWNVDAIMSLAEVRPQRQRF